MTDFNEGRNKEATSKLLNLGGRHPEKHTLLNNTWIKKSIPGRILEKIEIGRRKGV